jgi:hypothetical protein
MYGLYDSAPALYGETWRRRGRYEEREGKGRVWVRGETRRVYDVNLGGEVLYKVRSSRRRCTRSEWEAWTRRAQRVELGMPWREALAD